MDISTHSRAAECTKLISRVICIVKQLISFMPLFLIIVSKSFTPYFCYFKMIECSCTRNANWEVSNEEQCKWDKEKAIQKVFMICIVLFFVVVPFLMSSINKEL